MNRFYTIILTIILAFYAHPLMGDVVQRVLVQEYIPMVKPGEMATATKRPLANVELQVQGASSTITNQNGECFLKFNKLSSGDRIIVRHLSRSGYEILFPRMLNGLVIRRDNEPIIILMISQENLTNRYHRVEKMVTSLLEKQKRRDLDGLDPAAKDYIRKREEIERKYMAKLDDIEYYIDRLCRIDLTNLGNYEKELKEAYAEGDLDKILTQLENSNLIEKYKNVSEALHNVQIAHTKIVQARNRHEKDLKDIQQYIKFQITLLKMEGSPESLQKAMKLLQNMLEVNPFDYFPLKEQMELSIQQKEYHFIDSLLRSKLKDPNLSKYRFCRVSTDLASILFEQNRYDEAWDVLKKVDTIRYTLYLNENESSLSVFHRLINNQILGHICLTRGEQEAAVAHLLESFDAYKHLRVVDASSKLYADATYPRLIKVISDLGDMEEWSLADSIYNTAYPRVEGLYKNGSVRERHILACYKMWNVNKCYKTGEMEKAYLYESELLPDLRHIYSINHLLGQDLYLQVLRNVARYQYINKHYDQAIEYADQWFSVLRTMKAESTQSDSTEVSEEVQIDHLNHFTDMLTMYAYSLAQVGKKHHTEAVYCEVIDIMETNPTLIQMRPKRLAVCYANVAELRLDRGERDSARKLATMALQLNSSSPTAKMVLERIQSIEEEDAKNSSTKTGRKKH